MEHIEVAKVTSKGQVTIPSTIREILRLEPGSTVMFKVTKDGIFLAPCELIEKPSYSAKEWKAIEKLVAEKGVSYKTVREAKDHIDGL